MVALLIYIIINIFAWIALCIIACEAWSDYGLKYAFIYPHMWESLDDHDINLLGKIIVCILFTLLCAPGYVMCALTLGILLLGELIVKLFCKIFKKRK